MSTKAVALVVSDLYPYTADERMDRVYTVIEIEGEDRPHRAIVETCGIRKNDLVNVLLQHHGVHTYYRIIGKAVPAGSQKQHGLSPTES